MLARNMCFSNFRNQSLAAKGCGEKGKLHSCNEKRNVECLLGCKVMVLLQQKYTHEGIILGFANKLL